MKEASVIDEHKKYVISHLSPSTCQQYKTCSKAIYFNKILGIRDETTYSTTAYGSSFHKAFEYLFKEKMKGNKISLDEFYDVFSIEMTRRSRWITVWKEDTIEHLLEQGKLACEGFYKYWYNKFDPAMVEYTFNIDRGEGKLPIKTITDLITTDHKVVDWKFGRAAKIGSYLLNMSTYAKCYYDLTGIMPEVSIVKQKWSKKRQPSGQYKYWFDGFAQEKLPVDKSWFAYYDQVYDDVEKGIVNGVFVTASDSNGLCKECWYHKTGVCSVILLNK